MKCIILLLVFVCSLTVFSLKGQDTVRPFYGGHERLASYPVGSQKGLYIKGAWLPNGQQIIYDGNGYREYEMWGEIRRYYYRNGRSNGLVLFMDTTKTRINQIGYFIGDVKDGNWMTFYKNGQIESTVTYDSGKVVTPMTLYHANAQIKSVYAVNDKLEIVGNYEEYFETGELKVSGKYDFVLCKNLIDSLEYTISKDKLIPSPIRVGEWIEYFESGQIKRVYTYDHSCYFTVSRDSISEKVYRYTLFTNTCPMGVWTEYNEEGQIVLIERYKDCFKLDE